MHVGPRCWEAQNLSWLEGQRGRKGSYSGCHLHTEVFSPLAQVPSLSLCIDTSFPPRPTQIPPPVMLSLPSQARYGPTGILGNGVLTVYEGTTQMPREASQVTCLREQGKPKTRGCAGFPINQGACAHSKAPVLPWRGRHVSMHAAL